MPSPIIISLGEVLEVVVPVLHYLNDARVDQTKAGLMHIGVFILLLLSGERNLVKLLTGLIFRNAWRRPTTAY